MNKLLIIAFTAIPLAASPALADDNYKASDGKMKTEGTMNPTAGTGAPSNQMPGAETSDRTPQKDTTTPPTQVDTTKSGETSDRTPGNHAPN
ncbi:hypothetical protein [Hyphomicrobium sp. NDB2Meth4]|uniref:hypothetical protein n=1 Tax=Hyphomicrobium sp. NDB2Meth4 TaxID=1892846 RepID=UPI0009312817|nr:hypothetical protein [Hyphomicrobium sp. NDB2Meth4]